LNKKLSELAPVLLRNWNVVSESIPTNYGYFYIDNLVCYLDKVLKYIKMHKDEIPKKRYVEIERAVQKKLEFEGEIQINCFPAYDYEDVLVPLIIKHPDLWREALSHVVLFTKPLLNPPQGGRSVDPTENDGLYNDLRSARQFFTALQELRNWETDGLWESVWAPLGGIPSEDDLEKIPEEEYPFVFEEIRWDWGWEDEKGNIVEGYSINICDLRIYPNETLAKLERRIDLAIKPIKKYLASWEMLKAHIKKYIIEGTEFWTEI